MTEPRARPRPRPRPPAPATKLPRYSGNRKTASRAGGRFFLWCAAQPAVSTRGFPRDRMNTLTKARPIHHGEPFPRISQHHEGERIAGDTIQIGRVQMPGMQSVIRREEGCRPRPGPAGGRGRYWVPDGVGDSLATGLGQMKDDDGPGHDGRFLLLAFQQDRGIVATHLGLCPYPKSLSDNQAYVILWGHSCRVTLESETRHVRRGILPRRMRFPCLQRCDAGWPSRYMVEGEFQRFNHDPHGRPR